MAGSFALDLSRFGRLTRDRIDVVVRKVSLDLLSGVVFRTPVDTGRARGAWTVGVDALPRGTGALDQGGGNTVQAGAAKLQPVQAGGIVYIANNVEYIGALEDGHSQQAPQGMVALTLKTHPQIVEQAARQANR